MKKLMTIVVLGLILGLAGSAIASLDRWYQFETQTGGVTPDSASGVSGTLVEWSSGGGGQIVADSGGVLLHNGRVKKAENVLSCTPWGGMRSTYSGFTGSNDTIALWFKTDGPSTADTWNELFNCGGYDLQCGGNDESGQMPAGYVQSFSWNGAVATSKVKTPLAYDDGDWHYLVRTFEPYNAGGTKIYIDGLLVASSIYNGAAPAGDLFQVGTNSTTGWADYFKGRIDNVRAYSNAISATDVWDLYVSETTTVSPAMDRFYQYETNTGNQTPDSSANAVSGTLNEYPTGGSIVADTGGVASHNGRVKNAENVLSCTPWGGMYSTYTGFTGSNDTVALWFKTDGQWVPGVDNWNALFNCNGGYDLQCGGNDNIGPLAAGYVLSWSWNGSPSTSKVVTPQAYDDGDWHYLVRTFQPYTGDSSGGTKIYVDGLLVASSIYNGAAPVGGNAALQVGMSSTTGWADYFKGQIDNVRCYSVALGAGTVWLLYESETTVAPVAPSKAIQPSPGNGATNILYTAKISWADGGGATSYDVYFGTNPTPGIGEFKGNQTGTTYDPGILPSIKTTYYWRIDAKNSVGTTTGDVWSFTTACPIGSAEGDLNGDCVVNFKDIAILAQKWQFAGN